MSFAHVCCLQDKLTEIYVFDKNDTMYRFLEFQEKHIKIDSVSLNSN